MSLIHNLRLSMKVNFYNKKSTSLCISLNTVESSSIRTTVFDSKRDEKIAKLKVLFITLMLTETQELIGTSFDIERNVD